eukprot:Amastigsp_a516395_10.p2 type:complete len:197 gc:universal Amastigsp_a516395_10:686-96(-)
MFRRPNSTIGSRRWKHSSIRWSKWRSRSVQSRSLHDTRNSWLHTAPAEKGITIKRSRCSRSLRTCSTSASTRPSCRAAPEARMGTPLWPRASGVSACRKRCGHTPRGPSVRPCKTTRRRRSAFLHATWRRYSNPPSAPSPPSSARRSTPSAHSHAETLTSSAPCSRQGTWPDGSRLRAPPPMTALSRNSRRFWQTL